MRDLEVTGISLSLVLLLAPLTSAASGLIEPVEPVEETGAAVDHELIERLSETSFAAELAEQRSAHDSGEAHGSKDPVQVDLTLSSAPEQGGEATLTVNLTSIWTDLENVTVDLNSSDQVSVDGPKDRTVDLPRGEPQTVRYDIRPTGSGQHTLTVNALGETDGGQLGGHAKVVLDVPRSGAGQLFHNNVPTPEGVLPVEDLGGPLATSSDTGDSSGTLETSSPGLPEDREPVGEDEGTSGDSSGTTQVTIEACWFTWNFEDNLNTNNPQRWAFYQIIDSDVSTGDDVLAQGLTAHDGCFNRDVDRHDPGDGGSTDHQDIYVCWQTLHADVKVFSKNSGDTYKWCTGVDEIGDEEVHSFGNNGPGSGGVGPEAGRLFQMINNAYDFARFHGNIDVPSYNRLDVQVDDDGDSNNDCTHYHRSADRIDLCPNGSDDKSPDDVAHEFAHYIHDKFYGDSFWPSPGGSHFLCGDNQDRGLSWTEGFGDFFGPAADNTITEPLTTGDDDYSRPYDGSSFSVDMEAGTRCGSNQGDDTEMLVAFAMWDLWDAIDDGIDSNVDTGIDFILNKMDDCNDSTYNDFYNGGGSGANSPNCNWITNTNTGTGNACDFVLTAFENNIDFNVRPSATVTEPDSFLWVSGTFSAYASASDEENCSLDVTFRLSGNSTCSDFDTLMGTASTTQLVFEDGLFLYRYVESFDSSKVSDDASYWVCTEPDDAMEEGSYDVASSEIGIDNTLPSISHSLSEPTQSGWATSPQDVTLDCSDNLSGKSSHEYRVDGGSWQSYSGTFTIGSEGQHTVDQFCTDVAGNNATESFSVNIDTTVPNSSGSLSPSSPDGDNGWYVTVPTATIDCSDATSGCDHTDYSLDGGTTQTETSWPFDVTGFSDGTHALDFWSTDVAGNTEDTHSLGFKIDTVAPSTSVSLSGTEGDNGWYTSAVDVALSCSDATSGCDGTEYRIDGGSWQVYSGTFTVGDEGMHTVEYRSTDLAGNEESTGSVSFDIDTVAPSTSSSLSGTLGENGWYTSPVDVTLSCSDATSGCDGTEYRIDGGSWQAYSGTFTVSEEGPHTVDYRSTDVAGNTETTGTVEFKTDTVAPSTSVSLSGTEGDNGWYTSAVDVALSCSDATSGCDGTEYRIDGGSWQTYTGTFTLTDEGMHTVDYRSSDTAGNTESTQTVDVDIDTVAPSTTASLSGTEGDNGWYTSAVDVALSCNDGTSGCDGTEYRIDGGSWQTYSGTFDVSAPGSHAVDYRSTDVAGNTETAGTVEFKIDAQAPTTDASLSGTLGENGWYTSAVDVSLSCSDGASGCDVTEYRVDGGSWQAYSGTFTVSDEGSHTVEYRSTDLAGNQEDVATTSFEIDTQVPGTSVSLSGTLGENGWYTSPVDVTLSCSDATSGCDVTEYRIDGGSWQTYSDTFTVSDEGTHAVDYRSTDVAGNGEAVETVQIDVDRTQPALAVSLDPGSPNGANGWYNTTVDAQVSCNDAVSGVDTIEYRWDDGSWQATSEGILTLGDEAAEQGKNTLEVRCTDVAGIQDHVSRQVWIDTEAPDASVSVSDNLALGPYNVSWNVSDATSGLAGILEVQETNTTLAVLLDSDWHVACTEAVSGPAANGTCARDTLPGEYCYRVQVTDVAGNTRTTQGDACTLRVV